MPRKPRIVIPGMPHHVTQRGTRRQDVFFNSDDFKAYLAILKGQCLQEQVAVWAYCLMPNHVHLVLVPQNRSGLSRVIGKTHKRYAGLINRREGWTGHLWQERFYSCVMDERHALSAMKYVAQNPVRAGLVQSPEQWTWSSAASHMLGNFDALLSPTALDSCVGDWNTYLRLGLSRAEAENIRLGTAKGVPIVTRVIRDQLECQFGRNLSIPKRGRPKIKKDA